MAVADKNTEKRKRENRAFIILQPCDEVTPKCSFLYPIIHTCVKIIIALNWPHTHIPHIAQAQTQTHTHTHTPKSKILLLT